MAAVAYFFAALIFLLPLPFHWATFIPGDNGDSYPNLWPFWYYPHALLSGGSLFYHKLLFYPEGIHLVFTSASPVGAMLMSPVSLLISPAAALNCWLLLHLWLGGFFLFRFCRRLDCGPWAAWLGGFAFAWSPFLAVHITGHYTLAQVGYTAAALLSLAVLVQRCQDVGAALDRVESRNEWRMLLAPTAGLALSCWAVAVTDFYLAMMTLFLLLATLAHFALKQKTRRALGRKPFWLALVCAAAVTAALLAPWAVAIARARAGHDYSALDPGMGSKNIATWSRLITLPAYHSIWEPLFFQSFLGKLSLFNEWTYLGMIAFFVAGVGLIYVRPWRRSAVWIVAFVIALGLGAGNRYSVERGYASGWMTFGRWWPDFFPFAQFRVPGRWQFALCTVLAICLALGADALLYQRTGRAEERSKLRRAFFALAITAAIAFDQMRWPLPICEARPIDAGISVQGGTVLDIPVGIRSGQGHSLGQFDPSTLLRQMVHGRPILSANVSRLPNDVMRRLQADPELMAFFALQEPPTTASLNSTAPRTNPVDALTSPALHWPEFQKQYNITTVRIPLDWPTSSALRQMTERMGSGEWAWREVDGAMVGRAGAIPERL